VGDVIAVAVAVAAGDRLAAAGEVLCLWCYSYISRIIQEHSTINTEILDPRSKIITRISILDQPSTCIHLLVISPLPNLHMNRSTTTVERIVNKMCNILGSVVVAIFVFPMFTRYRQETWCLVTNQTTIQLCSNGQFLMRCCVMNIRPLWHFEMCRVIYEISKKLIVKGFLLTAIMALAIVVWIHVTELLQV